MLYFFENFVLDPARRELRHGNALIAVQPQVFDLLEYLITNRDRVVSKDDILESVWGGRIVSESAHTHQCDTDRRRRRWRSAAADPHDPRAKASVLSGWSGNELCPKRRPLRLLSGLRRKRQDDQQ